MIKLAASTDKFLLEKDSLAAGLFNKKVLRVFGTRKKKLKQTTSRFL